MTDYQIRIEWARLGVPGNMRTLDESKRTFIGDWTPIDGNAPTAEELAAIVSQRARKLSPSLKDTELRVRLTTPDGRPWHNVCFFIEGAGNGSRYGYGFIVVTDETGHKITYSPTK
jgi:hypothetical protein